MKEIPSVFNQLEIDNPSVFSTEGLSELLVECRMSLVKNYIKDCPSPSTYPSLVNRNTLLVLAKMNPYKLSMFKQVIDSPEAWESSVEIPASVKSYCRMKEVVGSDGMLVMLLYQLIRETIQEVQSSMKISALQKKPVAFRDLLFELLDYDDQLFLSACDRQNLKLWVKDVTQYFLNVTNVEPLYKIFQTFDDGISEEISVKHDEIMLMSNKAIYGYMSYRNVSIKLMPSSNLIRISLFEEKKDPDIIILRLATKWSEEEGYHGYMNFVAHNVDSNSD